MGNIATPMMKQYKKAKQKCGDAILFFRLGDFYEMFQQDAKEVSSLLNLTLTKRNGIPMCGIPYHAAQSYIGRLLKLGKKIAICEQISSAKPGKGIVEREITEVITPGTVYDESFLDKSWNNYLIALGRVRDSLSFSYIDSSTGEFFATSFKWNERSEKLKEELERLKPREALVQESLLEEDRVISSIFNQQQGILLNRFADWHFNIENSEKILKRQFGVSNLKGFGFDSGDPAIITAGLLLEYLEETSGNFLTHIKDIKKYSFSEFLGLDYSTQRNLELLKNLHDGGSNYTLLEVLDYTSTSMGARKLKSWLVHPLKDKKQIRERQNRVKFLYRNQILLSSIRERLKSILDIQRLTARVAMDRAHAKDLLGLKYSLNNLNSIQELLQEWKQEEFFLPLGNEKKRGILDIQNLLECGIHEDPSIQLNEGRLIKKGYSPWLDNLKKLKANSQAVLNDYLNSEKENTGIGSLKIKYNKIIGYYLEVTKPNVHLVPEHFIRRQSLVSSERYTTEKLIELETELNNTSEQIIELEKKLFLEIRDRVKEKLSLLLEIADFISRLDCYCSFAVSATIRGYSCPVINNTDKIIIEEGRHPVVEAHLPPGEFIPNNVELDGKNKTFLLITGPNMAGKSTYLRQTALLVLMAQIGSFVPAGKASIGIVDKIFCRVGATDNLAKGESTFLVEMNETANILRSATEKSLIIMDEVGRGTGTNDGLSIAWAVSEYILNTLRAKTLFATHYHELTHLNHHQKRNLSMGVKEKEGEIVFLKKVCKGASSNSYGIHVAKLAGLPEEVLFRAQQILETMANSSKTEEQIPKPVLADTIDGAETPHPIQAELFSPFELIERELQSIDVNNLTPLQALNMLARWKKEVER